MTGMRPLQNKRPVDDNEEAPMDNDNDNDVERDDKAPPPDNNDDEASAGQMAHRRQ